MELVAKELYHASFGTLVVGQSTEGLELSEDLKKQLVEDHPEMFDIVGSVDEADETAETKTGKTRKK